MDWTWLNYQIARDGFTNMEGPDIMRRTKVNVNLFGVAVAFFHSWQACFWTHTYLYTEMSCQIFNGNLFCHQGNNFIALAIAWPKVIAKKFPEKRAFGITLMYQPHQTALKCVYILSATLHPQAHWGQKLGAAAPRLDFCGGYLIQAWVGPN